MEHCYEMQTVTLYFNTMCFDLKVLAFHFLVSSGPSKVV